jgi:hypothetical protein
MAAKTAIDTEALLTDAERLIPLMLALSLKLGTKDSLPSVDDVLLNDLRLLIPVVPTASSLASCSGGGKAEEIKAEFAEALQPLKDLAASIGSDPFDAFDKWLGELWADEFSGEPGDAFDETGDYSDFEDAACIAGDVV